VANIAIFNFTPIKVNGRWKNLHYYNSFILAFKQRGHNVLNFITNDILCDPWNGHNVSISKNIERAVELSLKKFKPDLIISFNNSKINIIEKFDCPIVIAEADTVKYFSDKDSIKTNVNRYHFFYFTKNGSKEMIDFFKASKKKIFYIENATSIQSKKIEKIHDVSFIGSLYDPDKFFNLNKSDGNFTDYTTAVERKKILLELKSYKLKIYTNYAPDSYSDLVNCGKVSKKIIFDTKSTQQILNQSFMSLNHSHHQSRKAGYSWRVLDILASNSLLITEESDALKEKFGKNMQKQFYRSFHDIKKKFNYFLNNKHAMQDLIAEQNMIIDKHYRWADRIKKIEDIFQLKNKKEQKNSIIIFKAKNILLQKSLIRDFIFKILDKNLVGKRIYIPNKIKYFNIIKSFFKNNNNIIYRFIVRLEYFRKLKK
jgi:spore maturation protein CgeB